MKTFKFDRKVAKNIWWVGPFLLVMGLTAGVVSGNWLPIPLGLIIIGFVGLAISLLTMDGGDLNSAAQTFWGRRSTQTGTNAIAATASVLLILALINFVGVRYAVRADFSENKLHSLAPESQQVVRNLSEPAKVWIFDKNPNPADKDLLEKYQRQGSRFSYEYVDPDSNIGLAKKFGVKGIGEVYLESGDKRKFIEQLNENQRLTEEKITNGIGQIKSDRTSQVYFLQGHGEHPLESARDGLSEAMRFLEQKNLIAKPLNLAERGSIPGDAAVVVVAGPKKALFEQEVNVLRDYLKQGGSLLLLIDPNTDAGLDKLLDEWGVKLENRLAVDASDDGRLMGLGPAMPIVTQYGTHPITKEFGNGISFYQLARPLDIKEVQGVQATPLLLTNQESWAESEIENKELTFDPKSDRQGPLTLGVALNRKVDLVSDTKPPEASVSPSPSPDKLNASETPTPSPSPSPTPTPAKSVENTKKRSEESRLVVVGNSTFATDGMFGQNLNGDVFLNSVSWLSQEDNQTLSIRPKEARNRRLNLQEGQASLLAWMSIIILPLIGFGTAGWIWWRRR